MTTGPVTYAEYDQAGALRHPVRVEVTLTSALMPLVFDIRSWEDTGAWLAGPEFRALRERGVSYVHIADRNA